MTVVGDTVALLLTREGGGSEQVSTHAAPFVHVRFSHSWITEHRAHPVPRRRHRQLKAADVRQGTSCASGLCAARCCMTSVVRETMREARITLQNAPSAKRI